MDDPPSLSSVVWIADGEIMRSEAPKKPGTPLFFQDSWLFIRALHFHDNRQDHRTATSLLEQITSQ